VAHHTFRDGGNLEDILSREKELSYNAYPLKTESLQVE
jgi:hypothetical protein